MAGTMEHVELQFADAHRVALVQAGDRDDRLDHAEPIAFGGFADRVEQQFVVLMGAFDRRGKLAGERRHRADMIEMTMRDEDFLDRRAGLLDSGFDAFEIAAGSMTAARFVFVQMRMEQFCCRTA